MDFAAEAFYYAADNDARIVSCSWGSSNTGGIAAAIDYFLASGGMVFHAAGNDGNENQDYLASRSDIINVAATDTLDCKADFSNYGTWVDISAPGTDIWSSYHDHDDPAGDYVAPIDGTSMACPLAASVAALIWSQNLGWTAAQVETKLLESVDDIYALGCNSAYAGKLGSGRVNAFLAVSGGPPPPVAAFSGSPTSGCAALVVDFTDESTGDITSWSWTFGDGGTSAAQNPSYTYNDPGTYTVSLTVTGPGGSDTETKTGYITVNSAPTADFSGNPTGGTEPLTVDFTDLSAGNPTSWSWDFGDGGSSTQQNPSYTYNNAGTYTVTLTATNTCGSDGETKIDYITVDPCVPPTADFVGSPTNGTAPLTVDFTDLSTGNPTSWSWDFGDGGSSTQQNPSYTYNNAGTYTVTLTATNACGSDGETKVDYVTVDPPSNEKAFAQSDIPVKGTFSGNYANTHSSDNVYEIITEALSTSHPVKETSEAEHKWDFNLGSGGSNMMFYVEAYRPDNSDGDDFIFEYSTDDVTYNSLFTVASGTEQVYSAMLPAGLTGTVYVKVRDSNRSWDLTSLDAVYIDQMYFEYETTPGPPVADFSGTPTSGNYPLTVNFTDLSTGSPTSWSWDFGDMGTSTAQNPSHTYTAVGKYTVSLAVTNAYGSDTETKIDYINVTEPGQDFSHVHDMAVGRIKVGANNKGTCTVTIYDQNNTALADATVYVSYDGPNSGTLNGVTSGDGTVYFESAPYKKPPVQWCFEVTNVTHGTHTYDAAANNVTRACENGWVYGDGPAARSAVDGQIPYTFGLSQNYPNPFNPITEISFTLPSACYAKLEVFNIVGQKVTMLIDRQMNAGEHTCVWDGSDAASGVYFYRLEAGSVVETRKMILMK
jgi:PKD repeat protein